MPESDVGFRGMGWSLGKSMLENSVHGILKGIAVTSNNRIGSWLIREIGLSRNMMVDMDFKKGIRSGCEFGCSSHRLEGGDPHIS
jgi:hypothetical protein